MSSQKRPRQRASLTPTATVTAFQHSRAAALVAAGLGVSSTLGAAPRLSRSPQFTAALLYI